MVAPTRQPTSGESFPQAASRFLGLWLGFWGGFLLPALLCRVQQLWSKVLSERVYAQEIVNIFSIKQTGAGLTRTRTPFQSLLRFIKPGATSIGSCLSLRSATYLRPYRAHTCGPPILPARS